jgi:hypothetical protein
MMIPLPKKYSSRPAPAAFNLATLFLVCPPVPTVQSNERQDAYTRRQGSLNSIFEGSR